MSDTLFEPGGPLNIVNKADNQFTAAVTIPLDDDGRLARQCPRNGCVPGFFKVKPQNEHGPQTLDYCPYCRATADSDEFATAEQLRFATEVVEAAAANRMNELFADAVGVDGSGVKTIDAGLLSIKISVHADPVPPAEPPVEQSVRRDVSCPGCGVEQTVYGLAHWCAECGRDVFLVHVAAELATTRLMLTDVARRRVELGERAAARDLENYIEDAVSAFEAAAKSLVRRELANRGWTVAQIDQALRKLGAAFQNVGRTSKELTRLFGCPPLSGEVWGRLASAFERRHPITHNLGVADQRYRQQYGYAERVGEELILTEGEVATVLDLVAEGVSLLHHAILARPTQD